MTTDEHAAGAMPVAAMAGVIATVTVFAVTQGLTYPLLSFILQREGVSPAMIGFSAAMTPLGFIVSSPLIPWCSRRFGPGTVALACALLAAVTLTLIAVTQDVWLWFPLRFLLGLFANPLYVISETWLLAIAPADRRGRIMGVYTSIVSAGFAIGPLTLSMVGSGGWPPFIVGIACFLLCSVCLVCVLPRLPRLDDERHATSVAGFVALAPLLLFAVFAAAAFEQALLALFPVYGEAFGRAEPEIASILAVFIAGNIALQIPLGAMAERYGPAPIMILCAATAVLGSATLPFILASPLIWPVVFCWGAVAFGIYTMALIELGERFSGSMLITGNAAFALLWGAGGIAGPPAAGALMSMLGMQGLPVALILLCSALLICLAGTLVMRRRAA